MFLKGTWDDVKGFLLCIWTMLRRKFFSRLRATNYAKGRLFLSSFLCHSHTGRIITTTGQSGGPCENHTVLLHSSAVELGDNDVERGIVLKTVRRNFEGWIKREVKEAKLARTLQSCVWEHV